jgi:hypothetical protein
VALVTAAGKRTSPLAHIGAGEIEMEGVGPMDRIAANSEGDIAEFGDVC